MGKKVAVIGGGNVAFDAARIAVRNGAKSVTIIYRRTRDEMPASIEEIEEAEDEKIEIEFLLAPLKVIAKKGKVVGIECQQMTLGEYDESGRARPVPIPGSERVIEVGYDHIRHRLCAGDPATIGKRPFSEE